MFVHHVATISLLCFSWTCYLTRAGTIVIALHDVADIFLEVNAFHFILMLAKLMPQCWNTSLKLILLSQAAKMCKYTNYQKTCDVLYVCFVVTWIVTRLGIYPTWFLYSTTVEAPQVAEMFPAYYIFNGLLTILLVLHIFWTYFILKIVYMAIFTGKVSKLKTYTISTRH